MILSTEWPLCHVRELRYGLSKIFEGKSKILENAFLIFTIFTHPDAFIFTKMVLRVTNSSHLKTFITVGHFGGI